MVNDKKLRIMKLLDKIEKFDLESKKPEELYQEWGTTREEHQEKMLEFIKNKMKESRK